MGLDNGMEIIFNSSTNQIVKDKLEERAGIMFDITDRGIDIFYMRKCHSVRDEIVEYFESYNIVADNSDTDIICLDDLYFIRDTFVSHITEPLNYNIGRELELSVYCNCLRNIELLIEIIEELYQLDIDFFKEVNLIFYDSY